MTQASQTRPVISFYIREEAYGWLSNFERSPQVVDGVTYPTNEHFYQAMKCSEPAIRAWIAACPNAWHAMHAGRNLKKRDITPGWSDAVNPVKLDVMLKGLRAKFSQNADLAAKLLNTGNAILQESPKGGFTDSFWGNSPKPDGSPGDSNLGRLLMQVRDELRANLNVQVADVQCSHCTEHQSEAQMRAAGQAAGYPGCCIDYFVAESLAGREPARDQPIELSGYVKCPAHRGA